MTATFMVVGDTHARIHQLALMDQLATRANIRTVYQVGDFGIHWPGRHCPVHKYFNKRARNKHRHGPTWISCLGNHDNYDKLHALQARQGLSPGHQGLTQYVPPSEQCGGVWAAGRPTVHVHEGTTTVLFGGAESTDAHMRTPHKTWWKQESPTHNEFENLAHVLEHTKPQVLISHDVPTSKRPRRESWAINPHSNIPANYTAQNLQRVMELVDHKPPLWFYGHHHAIRTVSNEDTMFLGAGLHGQGWIVIMEETPIVVPFDINRRGMAKVLQGLDALKGKINWAF